MSLHRHFRILASASGLASMAIAAHTLSARQRAGTYDPVAPNGPNGRRQHHGHVDQMTATGGMHPARAKQVGHIGANDHGDLDGNSGHKTSATATSFGAGAG